MEVNIFSKIVGMLRSFHKGLFQLRSFSIFSFVGVLSLRLVSFTINTIYFALRGVLHFYFNKKMSLFDKFCYTISDIFVFVFFPYLYVLWLFLRFCFYLFFLLVSYSFIIFFTVCEIINIGYDVKPRNLIHFRNVYFQFDDWYFARKKAFFHTSFQFYIFWSYIIFSIAIYDRVVFPYIILPFFNIIADILIWMLFSIDAFKWWLIDGALSLEEFWGKSRYFMPELRRFYIKMYFKLIFRNIFTTVWYIISDFFFYGYQNLKILGFLFLFYTQPLRYNLRLLFLYIRLCYVLLFRITFYEYILKFVFYRVLYVLHWVRYFIVYLLEPALPNIMWGLHIIWNCIIFIYCLLPTPIADFIYGGALFLFIYIKSLYLYIKLFFASISYKINCLKYAVRMSFLYANLFLKKLKKAVLFSCFCLHVSFSHPGVVYGLLKWEFYICYIIIKDELTYKFRSLRARVSR